MVYFDEIFNALMDELLEEEVVYFNGLEAAYYLNSGQSEHISSQHNNNFEFIGNQRQPNTNKQPKNYYK
jgi:hypothetical protein